MWTDPVHPVLPSPCVDSGRLPNAENPGEANGKWPALQLLPQRPIGEFGGEIHSHAHLHNGALVRTGKHHSCLG